MRESFDKVILAIDSVDLEGKTDKNVKFEGKRNLKSMNSLLAIALINSDGTRETDDPTEIGLTWAFLNRQSWGGGGGA